MGFLIKAWEMSQQKFTMNMKQVVTNAGDGTLENDESVNELRQFFSMIDLHTMGRLLEECYSKDRRFKFDARGDARRGYAFQDMVNEMGRRLGYDVENGLYRGKKNEIGFDGLWKAADGTYIIMESKTSDDYAISIESVIGYRDNLIIDHKIPKKNCSILIVFGRDEKMALRNTVKGSNENTNIRLISANALFQLVKIYYEIKNEIVLHQINNLLRPRDYFVLDNLVELVFPQTDAEIDAIEDVEESEQPNVEDGKTIQTEDAYDKKNMKGKFKIVDDIIPDDAEKMYFVGRAVNAEGYAPSGTDAFVVLKGSQMNKIEMNSCPKGIKEMRMVLINEGVVVDYTFIRSVLFNSPSTAAACIYGGSQNGRIRWVNEAGCTLNDLSLK